ncbi:hypothetical protein H5V45_10910 [Nocardioides sp. KIGAM211]|uniref:Netrin module non-TIMP type domain-containing protein n=1 Tax=Nocardioides luti TaxID=2761101 RepID=A0A7X0RGD0_9ACTN|nr:hypothetical protein [Nocardioides luti]MBB6627826.1 hypothetical protein [Nocardioides luti]
MLASVGRLLAALLLAGLGLVLLGSGPASACPASGGSNGSTQDHTKDASDVFLGDVTAQSRTDELVTYDVTVDRVYKGGVASEDVQVTTSAAARSCTGVELTVGRTYVFFAQAGDQSGDDLSITRADGTARASGDFRAEVEKLLGSGRAPVPPEPDKAVFTRVGDATTTSLTRLAAPGAALTLVGLLGLVVVRRVGRHS